MTLAAGARLGPYTVMGPLGSGGMGEVYRARDDRLGRDVAVKVLRTDVATDAERLHRFDLEARAAGALNHPQLLTVFDTGLHDGAPYLVFELLEGETLRQRLAGGPLSPRRALDLAAGIAEGLAAAHEKGIVHRDLKPENVFVTREGRPKILDFGLAKLRPDPDHSIVSDLATVSGVTAPGTVLGTLGYMAPEQLQGQKVDHRTDIFALGLLLYEMLSGRRPFQRDTLEATVTAVLTQDPPPLALESADSQGAVAGIVARCLEKRPEARFQSAQDLAFALRALPLAGTSAQQARQVGRVSGRSLRVRAVVAAASLAALVAAFWLGRSTVSSPEVSYQRLTFRRGTIHAARFAPDGQTVVYGAAWEGEPIRGFMSRIGRPELTLLDLPPANVLAISGSGEMALGLAPRWLIGQWPVRATLARAPLAGGAPREILEDVDWADWAPDGGDLVVVHAVGNQIHLEYPIGTVLHSTGGWISHPRFSPGGDRIAFLDHPAYGDDGSVMIVNRTGRKTTLSAGWASLQGLAWHPNGREVWFTAARTGANSRLWAVTLSGRERLIAQAPARLTLHDFSGAGRVLFTRDSIQGGVIGLARGAAQERDYSWFDNSQVTDLSPDGTALLLDETAEGSGSAPSVYLRKMDGSPAVRLGEGVHASFSPDRKWALAMRPAKLVLLPTGPGAEKQLERHGIDQYHMARWFPDGKRIVFAGGESDRERRLYVQDLAGGQPRPVTPEGVSLPSLLSNPVSPEGAWLTGMTADRRLVLYPVEGGSARELLELDPADQPVLWATYGRVLYVFRAERLPAGVHRLDLETGRRELWKQILPPDPAGSYAFPSFVLTSDARPAYAYSYFRQLSELYVGEGLD